MKKIIHDILLSIRKQLPKPIKKIIRPIYHKFTIKIDEEMAEFLRNRYNLPRKEVSRLLESGGRLSADFWHCSPHKTEEEIKNFYGNNPFYPFNLIIWHSTKYQRNLRKKFIELARGRVLDYGGGVGDLSLEISKKGLRVDYADLPGVLFNFARELFEKNKSEIKMIDLNKEKISEKYDTIFCVDVIEHVVDPEKLLKEFSENLNIGGYLIITALETNVSEDAPMHFEIKFNPEQYLNSLGMVKAEEEFLWIKK